MPRRRQQQFAEFSRRVADAYPRRTLHIVCDHYSAHNAPAVTRWLAKNKRVTLHFTPTGASRTSVVESFFSITRQAIRRGSFASVEDLEIAIDRFIGGWNQRCAPLEWKKTADEILSHAKTFKNLSDGTLVSRH
jgi:transposase